MAGKHENGYVRLTTLVAVTVPVVVLLGGLNYQFVTLSIAPLQKDIGSNHDDIRDIRSQLVPRTEHNRDWAAADRQVADLQRQIDENRADIHGIYGPNDAIKAMSDRMDRIERILTGRQPVTSRG